MDGKTQPSLKTGMDANFSFPQEMGTERQNPPAPLPCLNQYVKYKSCTMELEEDLDCFTITSLFRWYILLNTQGTGTTCRFHGQILNF